MRLFDDDSGWPQEGIPRGLKPAFVAAWMSGLKPGAGSDARANMQDDGESGKGEAESMNATLNRLLGRRT